MSDSISRKAAKDAIAEKVFHDLTDEFYGVMQVLDDLPSTDRPKGHWVWNPNGMDWNLGAWVCSECRHKPETWWECDKRYNPLNCAGSHFCGNCGADMRGVDDESTL